MTTAEKKAKEEAELIKKEQETAAAISTPTVAPSDTVNDEPTAERKPTAEPVAAAESPEATLEVAPSAPVNTVEPAPLATPKVATPSEDPVRDALVDAYDKQNKSFVDYVQGMRNDYEREKAESEARVADAKRAARWAGATEVASSLANLIAVGNHNAVNQVYKTRTQDWMQRADAEAKEHRNRLSDLRQRQRDTELKMAQLRSSNDLALAQYDQNKRQQDITNAMAARKADLDMKLQLGKLTVDQYNAETNRMKEEANARYNEITAKSTAARNYAQAARYKKMDDNGIDITLGAFGDMPEEDLHVNPKSLLTTIKANINTVNLSESEKKEVKAIMDNEKLDPDEKAEALVSLVGTNPDMRRLIQRNAGKRTNPPAGGSGSGSGAGSGSIADELRG